MTFKAIQTKTLFSDHLVIFLVFKTKAENYFKEQRPNVKLTIYVNVAFRK